MSTSAATSHRSWFLATTILFRLGDFVAPKDLKKLFGFPIFSYFEHYWRIICQKCGMWIKIDIYISVFVIRDKKYLKKDEKKEKKEW
jgi:hypothetical protein